MEPLRRGSDIDDVGCRSPAAFENVYDPSQTRLNEAVTQPMRHRVVRRSWSSYVGVMEFVHWSDSGQTGASGTVARVGVRLASPMGTAFYLHDDYPNFGSAAFTPPQLATGMVEIVGLTGHGFTLTFGASTACSPRLCSRWYWRSPTATVPDGVFLQIGGDALHSVDELGRAGSLSTTTFR